MINLLALVSVCILALLAIFQVALSLGAPLGRFAWGGQHRILPMRLRIGSVISIFIYTIIAILILSKAQIMHLQLVDTVVNIGSWIIAGYFTLGVIMNGISRSKAERNLMTPVALALSATTLIVALS